MPSLDGLVARQLSLEVWHYSLISQDKACYASRRANATLLSLRAFISVFISQLLSFNYFNHLVHSGVASLFNLEYILTYVLRSCYHFLSLVSLQPQTSFQVICEGLVHQTMPCLLLELYSVWYLSPSQYFSIHWSVHCQIFVCLLHSFYSTLQFIPRKSFLLLTAA